MKKSCDTLKNMLNRNKISNFHNQFKHNGRTLSDPRLIANAFNDFFSNIDKNSNDIKNDNQKHRDYIKHLTDITFNFSLITDIDILKAIKTLKSKDSTGFDKISTLAEELV